MMVSLGAFSSVSSGVSTVPSSCVGLFVGGATDGSSSGGCSVTSGVLSLGGSKAVGSGGSTAESGDEGSGDEGGSVVPCVPLVSGPLPVGRDTLLSVETTDRSGDEGGSVVPCVPLVSAVVPSDAV